MFTRLGMLIPFSQREILLELLSPIILATSFCFNPLIFRYFRRRLGMFLYVLQLILVFLRSDLYKKRSEYLSFRTNGHNCIWSYYFFIIEINDQSFNNLTRYAYRWIRKIVIKRSVFNRRRNKKNQRWVLYSCWDYLRYVGSWAEKRSTSESQFISRILNFTLKSFKVTTIMKQISG